MFHLHPNYNFLLSLLSAKFLDTMSPSNPQESLWAAFVPLAEMQFLALLPDVC